MKTSYIISFLALLLFSPLAQSLEIETGDKLAVEFTQNESVVFLEFDTVVGRKLQIEFSLDLNDWSPYSAPILGTGNRDSKLVTAGGARSAFFRIVDAGAIITGTPIIPSRQWQANTASRQIGSEYTNTNETEIEVSLLIGSNSGPGVYDSPSFLVSFLVRKDSNSAWQRIDRANSNTNFLTDVYPTENTTDTGLGGVVPSGWQYKAVIDWSDDNEGAGTAPTIVLLEWNELS